ncbi:MAG: glycosyltransferase family 39 protein [Zavarzinella sp.]
MYSPQTRSNTALAIILIASVTIIRLLYLYLWCPYDMAPDEAHYWDWSRHLDWSYYSKGPLIAWIIRAAIEFFQLVNIQTASLMPVIRTPAVLLGAMTLWGIYLLVRNTTNDARLALIGVGVSLTLPPFHMASIIMTIDSPYLCCWTWATVCGWDAVQTGRYRSYIGAGIFLCLGILAKYTMFLWLVSFGIFLILTPQYRGILFSRKLWLLVAIGGLSGLPILWWNSQHDWVSFKHVAVQAAGDTQKTKTSFRWYGPFVYFGTQMGVMLVYWFAMWLIGIWRARTVHRNLVSQQYLIWLSVPTFLVFGIASFRSAGQVNWPAATYISGIVLAFISLPYVLNLSPRWLRILFRIDLLLVLALGGIGSILLYNTKLIHPILMPWVPVDSAINPTPIRKFDPACRLKGWHGLAQQVDIIREDILTQTGEPPLIAGTNWTIPGQLGIYCSEHPTVYSVGIPFGDRHSQYDHWMPNPIANPEQFAGKTFIIVGIGVLEPILKTAFDSVEKPVVYEYMESGRRVVVWQIYVCKGYRRFPKLKSDKY